MAKKPASPSPLCLTTSSPQARVDTASWHLPALENLAELRDLLELHPDDFGWLLSPRAHHYHEQWLAKASGGRRLLESPKPLLKQTQRLILKTILDQAPAHEAATGFCLGRSILDFARPHTEKAFILKMDLANFFPSLGRARIKRIFLSYGYRENVAYALACLCTTETRQVELEGAEKELYQRFHLPQGAPTSPALANLAAFRLDCRLAGLARSVGAHYTRYADDLLFSGAEDFARQAKRVHVQILAIILEEGLAINPRKTRFMPRSQRQSAAGLVLNDGLNGQRKEYDTLKAILHNCGRDGFESQNREQHPHFEAHLKGRIQWLASLNPRWGEKLQTAFDQISPQSPSLS